MHLNIDASCTETQTIVDTIMEKVLNFVEKSDVKRKDSVRNKLKKEDESLLVIFDNLIKRRAIICSSVKISGNTRTVLSVANRNFINYAMGANIDVPSESELKEAFDFWCSSDEKKINSLMKIKNSKIVNYEYLKKDEEGFKKYIALPFNEFSLVTDFCTKLYKEYIRERDRVPVKNPFIDKYKNVILNQEEYEAKEDERCDDVCDISYEEIETEKEEKNEPTEKIKCVEFEQNINENKETNVDQETTCIKEEITNKQETELYEDQEVKETHHSMEEYVENIIRKNKLEKEKQSKHNPVRVSSYLNSIQDEITNLIENLKIEFDAFETRNEGFVKIDSENKTINVLLAKLLLDYESLTCMNPILKSMENLCNAITYLKNTVKEPLTDKEVQTIINLT